MGHNGVVGHGLISEISKTDHDWLAISKTDRLTKYGRGLSFLPENNDFTNYDIVRNLICNFKTDVVYNLAATSTSSSPASLVWKNTTITLNLLEAIRETGYKTTFIQASSIVVDQSNSVYAASKSACEKLVNACNQLYDNITAINVRFPAVVGLGAKHGLLPDIIRKLSSDDKVLELWGHDPGSVKPYIYSKTLAEGLVKLLDITKDKIPRNGVLARCPSDSISVRRVAEIVMQETGINKEIIWDASKVWIGDDIYIEPFNSGLSEGSEDAILAAVKEIINE